MIKFLKGIKSTQSLMKDELRIMLAGGGTGGHLYPAVAIAKEIESRFPDSKFLFIGTRRGVEARVLPELGYDLRFVWLQGMRRNLSLLLFPFQLVISLIQCIMILSRYKPHVVIGTGGYVSGPAIYIAAKLGYPTIIQEQNSFPGKTTRWLSKVVNQVHLTFEDSMKYFPDQDKLYLSGNPVRSKLSKISREDAAENLGIDATQKTLLIFGGSQGARSVNQAMVELMPAIMASTEWQVLWGTGETSYEMVKEQTHEYRSRIHIHPYISDMASAYGVADLVVSRAGATSLAELQACGIATVLIPYPFAAANHQEANARSLVEKNAAKMVLDSELKTNKLMNELNLLFNDETARKILGDNLKALAMPDAAKDIVDHMLELIAYDTAN